MRDNLDCRQVVNTTMISLVSTVYNDCAGVHTFLDSMHRQTRLPDEVVIVDAGSRDGTWELLKAAADDSTLGFDVIAIQDPGCNVARGRNLAIKSSTGEIIVSTDMGCEWDSEWMQELVEPLLEDESIDLVIGSWAVKRESLIAPWALAEWALKGDQKLIADQNSYSSSRSIAYRRRVWTALGGYPEDLAFAADDAMFHYLAEKAQVSRTGAPRIRCYWHRHDSLRGFVREAARYGYGDGESLLRRKHVLLSGGRLAFEVVALTAGLVLLATKHEYTIISLLLLAAACLSIGVRCAMLLGPAARLQAAGVSRPFSRVLLYTYLTRWRWLTSWLRGAIHGTFHCRDCRMRLSTMTPNHFQARLADLRKDESLQTTASG